jgi:hypothetical protein
MWKSGSAPISVSWAVTGCWTVDCRMLATRLRWVSITPLGRPVVPLEDVGVRAREDHVAGSLPAMTAGTDFYLLDERLTDEERAIRDRLIAPPGGEG